MIYCFLDEWQFEPYHVSNNQSFHIQVSGWKKGWVWDDRNLNKNVRLFERFCWKILKSNEFHVPRIEIGVKYKSIKYLLTYSSPSRVFSTVCCRCKRHVRFACILQRLPRAAGRLHRHVGRGWLRCAFWSMGWLVKIECFKWRHPQKLPTFTKSLYMHSLKLRARPWK